jgi:hypothetical protein
VNTKRGDNKINKVLNRVIKNLGMKEEKEFKRVAGLINNDGYFSENKLIYIDLANKNYANLSKLLNSCPFKSI